MPKPPASAAIRVASVPAAHPYVAGLGLTGAGVSLLADPPVPGAPPGQWWPPVMLDPGWIAAHRDAFDLMHLHFASESLSESQLRAVLAALRRAGRPLVYTVHDLTHPQLADQAPHRAQLALLLAEADALVTLTAGAAGEIRARSGREATVIGHPAMLTGPRPAGDPAAGDAAPVVGVHLRDLRPGIDGPGTVARLAEALAAPALRARGVRGAVWMHAHTRDPGARDAVRRGCAAADEVTLHEGPRPDDDALHAQLDGLAVSVVPYRHGTHSGWVELCWDLGVPVAVPAVGHVAEQHPDAVAVFAAGDLAAALEALLARPEARPGSPERRRLQRARRAQRRRDAPRLAGAQVAVYRAVLDAATGADESALRRRD